MALVGHAADGTLETAFGTGGILRVLASDPTVYDGDFRTVVRLADGRLVAGGTIGDTLGATTPQRCARRVIGSSATRYVRTL